MYILKRSDRLINFSTYTTTTPPYPDIGFLGYRCHPRGLSIIFKSYFASMASFGTANLLPIYADAALKPMGCGNLLSINMSN